MLYRFWQKNCFSYPSITAIKQPSYVRVYRKFLKLFQNPLFFSAESVILSILLQSLIEFAFHFFE